MGFIVRSREATDMPRVLLLTTTFFPDAAVGAIRMTQLARHLPALGWRPIVVCRYYGWAATRAQLDATTHPMVETHYLGAPGPDRDLSADDEPRRRRRGGAALDFGRRLAEIVAVPDPGIFVWRRARTALASILDENAPELVVTTGPAHSVHDAGRWLKNYAGIPWIADFRDPYLIDMVYAHADATGHCVPTHYRWARRRYPFARERMCEIMNGYVGRLREAPLPVRRRGVPSRVLVAGAIMSECQTGLARAIGHLARTGHDIELRLIGRRPQDVAALQTLCEGRLTCTGYLPHEETIEEILRASVLINFRDFFHAESFALGLKLIEYLATRTPIVCINPTRAERSFLRNRPGVECLSGAGSEKLAQAIRNALEANQNSAPGQRAQGLVEWNGVGQRFSQLFRDVIAARRS